MYPTYHLSYATLNASLALSLVVEALSGSGEPDQSAGSQERKTPCYTTEWDEMPTARA